MVYPVTLPNKLVKDIRVIAARKGRHPDELIERVVQDWVRQETTTQSEIERSQELHARIKANLRKRNPALKRQMSRRALIRQMEQLSEKASKGLPFATWQKAQSFARGEDRYDFVRHSATHLITWNKKDFAGRTKITVMTPEEFLHANENNSSDLPANVAA